MRLLIQLQQGRLLHIHQLKPWSLMEVLTQKYEWPFEMARQFASFLLPMLAFEQDERATATQCLQHDWLKPYGGKSPSAVNGPPPRPAEIVEIQRHQLPSPVERSFSAEGLVGDSEPLEDSEPEGSKTYRV